MENWVPSQERIFQIGRLFFGVFCFRLATERADLLWFGIALLSTSKGVFLLQFN